MLFDSTSILLRSIVSTLENAGEIIWEDHLESGNQCLYELHQMSHSSNRINRADPNARFQTAIPPFERAIRTIPHLKSMMRSIRSKDRAAAVESERAAIAMMDGTRLALCSAQPTDSKADTSLPVNSPEQPAKTVHRHKKPAAQKGAPVAKRKSVRVSAATTRS
jgi:hypothetical protein